MRCIHTIVGGYNKDNGDEEDVLGLVLMLVDETGSQQIGGTTDESILALCVGCGQGVIGARRCPGYDAYMLFFFGDVVGGGIQIFLLVHVV